MSTLFALIVLLSALVGSFVFGTLAFALRDYSRQGLAEWFERRQRSRARGPGAPEPSPGAKVLPGEEAQRRAEAVATHEDDLALTAAVARTAANLLIALSCLHLAGATLGGDARPLAVYAVAFGVALALIGVAGVAIPMATSAHAAEGTIGFFARLLRIKRTAMRPVLWINTPIDRIVRRAAGRGPESTAEHVEQEIEQEILDIVNEGRDEGVIDEAEREMIERTIRFQDATAEQAMTPRGDVEAVAADASPEEVLDLIDKTGYSRIPVYEGTIDHVIGILYARDLFRFVGKRLNGHDSDAGDDGIATRVFDLPGIVRKPIVVPESKRLADLLRDMQLQKIHMAIVLDEYGGTSGLVTIEDVIEELVGDITDEHEEDEDAMFERESATAATCDARLEVDELNRLMGLHLPEDDAYETLGGFVTTTLGRIPEAGATFEREVRDRGRVTFTVVDAEPQRVNRVRLELTETLKDAEAPVDVAG